MELQWPLILFTTFIAWCAGTFATQAILALKGKAAKAQLTCWIVSAVLLVIGGIAVFMHLEHWERIFNGFGHITSGITQELIAIVVLAVIAIVYLVYIKREEGKVPAWVAVLAIIFSIVLIVVMGHSYMMEARPAWNNIWWIVSLLGAACVLGPVTVAAICDIKGEESGLSLIAIIGAVINAAGSIAALLSINNIATSSLGEYWFDLTHPTMDIIPAQLGAFSPACSMLSIVGVIIIGSVLPIICAIIGKKNWKVFGIIAAVCAVVGAICLRVVFYMNGVSVFGQF